MYRGHLSGDVCNSAVQCSGRPNGVVVLVLCQLAMSEQPTCAHCRVLRTGGKISLDKEGNAAIYGASTDTERVLAAPLSTHSPPAALRPLYETLDEIAADAERDQRKFSGFKKHWHPDTSAVKTKQI